MFTMDSNERRAVFYDDGSVVLHGTDEDGIERSEVLLPADPDRLADIKQADGSADGSAGKAMCGPMRPAVLLVVCYRLDAPTLH